MSDESNMIQISIESLKKKDEEEKTIAQANGRCVRTYNIYVNCLLFMWHPQQIQRE